MDYYDQISEGYEELHKEEQEKKLNLIKKHLQASPYEKLLDVGCGTGITSQWGCNVTGVDPSKKLLEKAKQKGIKTVLAEAENMPFRDNEFDIVISVTAIQNFNDIEKGLKEIKRVGKGRFVLTFLKKSEKRDFILNTIRKLFKIEKEIEEDKDIIIFAGK
ncbi:MAG: class I SAM-dependent methyltransferase [Candidatus Woesearchaeota archaeon]|nr:class I SAM-dependent methyltransferase [Candidatus Woesearchaeota archaeon]